MHRTLVVNNSLCPETLGGSCGRCLTVCPSEAILLHDGPAIRAEVCRDCGACASVCPSGALALPTCDSLLRQLRKKGKCPEILLCPSAHKGVDTEMPFRACLAGLGVDILLELWLMNRKAITLVCGDCGSCKQGDSGTAIHQAAKQANAIIANSAVASETTPFTVVCRASRIDSPEKQSHGHTVSRRDFLGMFRGRESAAHTEPQTAKSAPAASENKRTHLATLLKELKASGPLPKDFVAGNIQGNGTCTACAACVRICPTNALSIKEDGNSCSLTFKSMLCMDCGSCLRVCRTGFLERAEATLETAASTASVTLFSGTIGRCRRCNAKSAALSADQHCPICSRKLQMM